jgi:hypothetical protein
MTPTTLHHPARNPKNLARNPLKGQHPSATSPNPEIMHVSERKLTPRRRLEAIEKKNVAPPGVCSVRRVKAGLAGRGRLGRPPGFRREAGWPPVAGVYNSGGSFKASSIDFL